VCPVVYCQLEVVTHFILYLSAFPETYIRGNQCLLCIAPDIPPLPSRPETRTGNVPGLYLDQIPAQKKLATVQQLVQGLPVALLAGPCCCSFQVCFSNPYTLRFSINPVVGVLPKLSKAVNPDF
jgi:hypothetical protein